MIPNSSPPPGVTAASHPLERLDDAPNFEAPVPIVDLPRRCDESGDLIPEISPRRCNVCQWDGEPGGLFIHAAQSGLPGISRKACRTASPDCASCKLKGLILRDADLNLKIPPSEDDEVGISGLDGYGSDAVIHFKISGEVLHQSLFIPSGVAHCPIHEYIGMEGRLITRGAAAESSAKWAQERVSECLRSHESCKPPTGSPFLPTRLIDVSSDGLNEDVRLQETKCIPPGSAYTTLSYCWGAHRPACITTPATMGRNMDRITWESLPLTFQDAVKFTRRLGLRYLWIDSICIIQGDEDDWHRESTTMFDVYRHSYLTLAALFGHDSSTGLRAASIEQDSRLLATLRVGQITCPLYIRRHHYLDQSYLGRSINFIGRMHYPLLRRAWTYQERMVSPRVLYFDESEVVYQCFTTVECECGSSTEVTARYGAELNGKDIMLEGSMAVMDASDDVTAQDLSGGGAGREMARYEAFKTWRWTVLDDYSYLELTEPKDRLPAIGALAECFQQHRPGETYLAGLWSGSLLGDLLWTSGGLDRESDYWKRKKQLNRPCPAVPTWSWASLKAGAHYAPCIHYPDNEPAAEVVEVRCTYVGGNPFGMLESSTLILRGSILPCMLEWDWDLERDPWSSDCHLSYLKGGSWTRFIRAGFRTAEPARPGLYEIHTIMDSDGEGYQNVPSCQEVYLFEIMRCMVVRRDGELPTRHFLILRLEDQQSQIYTRAGRIICYLPESNDCEREEEELPEEALFERVFEEQSTVVTCELR